MGANVVIPGEPGGAATDNAGRFRLARVRTGHRTLVTSHVGYRPETTGVDVKDGVGGSVVVRLVSELIELPEIRVQSQTGEPAVDVTVRELSGDDLRYRAGGFVQDAVRALSFLPGVTHSTRGEWSGMYVVRGGDPDESRLVLGRTEPLWAYHLLGFSSYIDNDIVGSMRLYPGVFPVRYGGALSSITVVEPKRRRQGEGSFAYDPMNMKASYIGNLGDLELLGSVRKTFYNVLFGPLSAGRDNRPSFQDAMCRIGLPLGRASRIEAEAVTGHDRVSTSLRGVSKEMVESGKAASVALLTSASGLDAALAVHFADHDYSVSPSVWSGTAGTRHDEVTLRADFGSRPAGWVELTAGLEAGRARFEGNLLERAGFELSDGFASGYAGVDVRPESVVWLDLGVRYEDVRWVNERYLEPRAVLGVRLGEWVTLKAGYRRAHQQPYSFLTGSVALTEFEQDYQPYQVLAAAELRAKRADHLAVGVEIQSSDWSRLSIEAYDKRYTRLPTWRTVHQDGLSGFGNEGYGSARGIETVFECGPVSGWRTGLSHALSWTRKRQGTDSVEYWDTYDRRHQLSLVVERRFGEDWFLSTALKLHTGSPYTPLLYTRRPNEVGVSDLNRGQSPYVIVGEKNSARVPTYHRLDFKVQREFPKLPFHPFVYVEVLNLYNHENVYHQVQVETRSGSVEAGRFTGIQFIPLIGIGGRF